MAAHRDALQHLPQGVDVNRLTYDDLTAWAKNLDVRDGEFFVLLGPSGSGKTTLLRCLAGLEAPERGTITIEDRDVTDEPPRKRNLAMVFQSYAVSRT